MQPETVNEDDRFRRHEDTSRSCSNPLWRRSGAATTVQDAVPGRTLIGRCVLKPARLATARASSAVRGPRSAAAVPRRASVPASASIPAGLGARPGRWRRLVPAAGYAVSVAVPVTALALLARERAGVVI